MVSLFGVTMLEGEPTQREENKYDALRGSNRRGSL